MIRQQHEGPHCQAARALPPIPPCSCVTHHIVEDSCASPQALAIELIAAAFGDRRVAVRDDDAGGVGAQSVGALQQMRGAASMLLLQRAAGAQMPVHHPVNFLRLTPVRPSLRQVCVLCMQCSARHAPRR